VLWDRGRGGEYLSLFMIGSDPKRVDFTNPAQSRRFKILHILKNTAVTPQGKKQYLCGVLS
jgi:hypothetical protein